MSRESRLVVRRHNKGLPEEGLYYIADKTLPSGEGRDVVSEESYETQDELQEHLRLARRLEFEGRDMDSIRLALSYMPGWRSAHIGLED